MSEQRRRQLSAEQQAAEVAAFIDQALGPVLAFDVHRGMGCPKCGAPAQALQKEFCHGNDPRLQSGNKCHVIGEHLHGGCQACHFQWREQTADADLHPEVAAPLESKPIIIGSGGSA